MIAGSATECQRNQLLACGLSLTYLLYLDDILPAHLRYRTIPGSHKGLIYPQWQDGGFTGAVDNQVLNQQANS
jgi:hypothetical protein